MQRQRVVQFRPKPGVDAQFPGLVVQAARRMHDIQVDLGRQRNDLAPDFRLFRVDVDEVDIGGVPQERGVAAQGTGQVGCHQPGIREGALPGGFFGNADKAFTRHMHARLTG